MAIPKKKTAAKKTAKKAVKKTTKKVAKKHVKTPPEIELEKTIKKATKAAKKRSAGRPSKLTKALSDRMFDLIGQGLSVRQLCTMPDMPSEKTFHKWKREVDGFSQHYARACEARCDGFHEQMIDIADDGTNDWIESYDRHGEFIGWKENGEALRRSEIRINTRKWIMERMNKGKYGNSIKQEHTGADGKPLAVAVPVINLTAPNNGNVADQFKIDDDAK